MDYELKTTPGYYKGCQVYMNDDKDNSLGETMKLRDLLDCWWNCVHTNKGTCWKDAYYNQDGSMYTLNGALTEEDLDKEVQVDDEWEEDGDGYPIVFCNFVEEDTIHTYNISIEARGFGEIDTMEIEACCEKKALQIAKDNYLENLSFKIK